MGKPAADKRGSPGAHKAVSAALCRLPETGRKLEGELSGILPGEESPAVFHQNPEVYRHYGKTEFETGLELELLQEKDAEIRAKTAEIEALKKELDELKTK